MQRASELSARNTASVQAWQTIANPLWLEVRGMNSLGYGELLKTAFVWWWLNDGRCWV